MIPASDAAIPDAEDRTPPVRGTTAGQWLRANLFSSWVNSAITVAFGLVCAWLVYRAARFVLVTAEWEIVRRNLTNFMIGRFDRTQLWRPWVATGILAATIGLVAGALGVLSARLAEQQGRVVPSTTWQGAVRRFWPLIALVVFILSMTRTIWPTVITMVIVAVGVAARWVGARLPDRLLRLTWLIAIVGLVLALASLMAAGGVGWGGWGGIHVNIVVSAVGIVLAFPLGMLVALGRRSSLPVVRWVSVVYIEFFRGVPLLALLLVAQFVVQFFLPPSISAPSFVMRALIVIVLFESAYIAEIVRGGLQAVGKGQVEAAQALGMSPWTTMRRIVLPQALRAVIPAMVGQFISLFQDTTLLYVLGTFEVLQVAQVVTNQDAFVGQGLQSVTLPFVAFIFWAISYSMSRESRRLETRLGIGTR
ncbi:MAG: amino acid ABC transporter permease [Acidimicrobiales bacterium]